MESHEKNGPVLLQNVASTASGTQTSGWFIGGTRKERRCFAAECGPDPFEHTRALESPFSDPKIRAPSNKSSWGRIYWSHTKRTALFCCRTWPRPPRAHKPPDGLLGAHERNGAVLLQNAAPTPLGTHEHSRVHFLILRPGLPLLNGVGTEFIGVARKERRCFGVPPINHPEACVPEAVEATFCSKTRPFFSCDSNKFCPNSIY